MGTIFPLFTEQLYARLTYHWGTTLFAFIAVAMIPIPYVSPPPRARSIVNVRLTRFVGAGAAVEGPCDPRA